MKVTIKTTEPQSREVDWSKPMVVTDGKDYIRTTGCHTESGFYGTDLQTGEPTLRFKNKFTPCTTPITVTFENEL